MDWFVVLEGILNWVETHSGLASWVQAVGSIGAILAAVWIMSRQHSRQEAREKAAIQSTYNKASAVTRHVAKYVRETTTLLAVDQSFGTIDKAKIMVDSMLITLNEQPFYLLEDPSTAMAWINVRAGAMEFRRTLDLMEEYQPSDP